jgi:hypothetical protein
MGGSDDRTQRGACDTGPHAVSPAGQDDRYRGPDHHACSVRRFLLWGNGNVPRSSRSVAKRLRPKPSGWSWMSRRITWLVSTMCCA